MRRVATCLLVLVLVAAFSSSWAARRDDPGSTSKGFDTNCADASGTTIFYISSSPVVVLTPKTYTDANNNNYTITVQAFDWGLADCSTTPVTELPNSTATPRNVLLEAFVSSPVAAPPLLLRTLTISATLANPAYVTCNLSNLSVLSICNDSPVASNTDTDNQSIAEPSAVVQADPAGTLWSFGTVYDPNPNASPLLIDDYKQNSSNPQTIVPGASAVLVADGDVASSGLSTTTPYTVTLIDANGNIVTLGPASSAGTPTSGAAYNLKANALPIVNGVFNQIYDLSGNYPLETAGAVNYGGGNLSASDYPAPSCAMTSGLNANAEAFRSIWFEFTSPVNTQVSVSTAGSHFDTVLSVSELGTCNDDYDPASLGLVSSQVIFSAAANTAYHILVTEFPPPDPAGYTVQGIQSNDQSDTVATPFTPLSSDPILSFSLTTPQLTATPAASAPLSFGSVAGGMTSPAQVITLAAQYSGSTGISGITPAITGSSDFQIAANTCPSPSTTALADGTNCTISLVFAPSAAEAGTTVNGSLSVTSAAENSPITFNLSGKVAATMPGITVSTTSLAFDNQPLSTASATSSVVVMSSGTAPLTVSVTGPTGDFSQTNNCASSVAVGAQCTISVTFTPTQTGSRTGQLTITDNAANLASPQQIQLSGTGTDFTLQAASGSSLSATVSAGATATYNLVLAPVSGFTGTVALSCTGAPSGGTCTASPASAPVNGGSVNVVVSVATPASASQAHPQSFAGTRSLGAATIPIGAIALIAGIYRRRRLFVSMTCVAAVFIAGSVSGCGGGSGPMPPSPPTPPTPMTSTLTLSGVSGMDTHSVSLTLTIQ